MRASDRVQGNDANNEQDCAAEGGSNHGCDSPQVVPANARAWSQ
jgi:hypothetical protein